MFIKLYHLSFIILCFLTLYVHFTYKVLPFPVDALRYRNFSAKSEVEPQGLLHKRKPEKECKAGHAATATATAATAVASVSDYDDDAFFLLALLSSSLLAKLKVQQG